MLEILTMLLFSQHTGDAEQALPVPTPMMVRGEQFRPSRPVTPSSTMPKRPRSRPAAAEEDYTFVSVSWKPSSKRQ